MLGVTAASSSSSPAQWPRDPGSLMDVPATFTSQRHIHMLRGHGHGGYTGCHRQAAAFNSTCTQSKAHTRHKCRPAPGRDRRSLLQAHTPPPFRFTDTHTFVHPPSTIMAPLPAQHPGPAPRPPYPPRGHPNC